MNWLQRLALTLVIIGAINWGLIGFFNFDLVATIFGGQQSILSRIIYSLVGLSGVYALTILFLEMNDSIEDRDVRGVNRPNYGTEISDEFDTDERDDYRR